MNPSISSFNSMADTGGSQALMAAPKAAPARPGGLKGFLINNLPSIAGGIGAVGGEALDPFGGGIVTGALASGAGEALKEKLLGQNVSAKQVGIQALEGGAMGGVGKVLGGARSLAQGALDTGAKTATETGATDLAGAKPTLGQKVSNFIGQTGQKMQAKVGGFAPGQKVAGQQLDTAASQRIGQTLANENIRGLSPDELLKGVEGKLNSLGGAHGAITDASNTAITPEEKQAILKEFNDRLTNPNNERFQAGGSSSAVQKYAQTYANEIGKANDLSALGKYKTGLDNNEINYNSTGDAATNARNIAAKTARTTINDYMNEKIPALAAVNDRMSALHDAKGALLNSAGKLANLTSGGEGIWGRVLGGETAEKGKMLAGKVLSAVGNAGSKTATPAAEGAAKSTALQRVSDMVANAAENPKGIPKTVAKGILGRTVAPVIAKPGATAVAIGKNIAGRGIGSLVMNGPGTQQANGGQTTNVPQYGTSGLDTSAGGTGATGTTASSSPYPEENMLYDIERDPTHASTYEALYKAVNPTPSATSLDNLTTSQKNQLTGSQNAIAALQGYVQQVEGTTGPVDTGPVAGRVGAFLGKYGLGGQGAANAHALDSSASDVAVQIASGLSPTGRPTQSLVQQIRESLPQVSDSPEVRQAKTQQLISRLQATMQTEATPLSSYVNTPGNQTTLDPTQLATLLGQQ